MDDHHYADRILASPVSRDGFFHSGSVFSVEVDGHRHPRAHPSSLHSLLTYTPPSGPTLTKAGKAAKRQRPPHRDEPGHFYCAQLLHYGLKPWKTKEAAKRNLLAAFNGSTNLQVPAHILKLERELAEEHKQANVVARKQYIEDKENARKAEEAARKKRKQEEAVFIKSFDGEPVVFGEADELRSRLGKLSKTQMQDLLVETAESFDEANEFIEDWLAEHVDSKRKKTTKPGRSLAEDSGKEDAIVPQKHKKATQGKSPGQSLKGPGPSKVHKITAKQFGSVEGPKSARPWDLAAKTLLMIEGEFEVMAPYLTDQWPDMTNGKMTIKFATSRGSSHLWGSFDLGVYSGIMRSDGPPNTSAGLSIHLKWRGHEAGEGVLTFDDDNLVQISFTKDGNFKGRMNSELGEFEIFGKSVPRPNVIWSMSVRKWKASWRSMTSGAYEAANVARWGKWVEEPAPERPAASDTTDRGAETDDGLDEDDDEVEEGDYSDVGEDGLDMAF